MSRYLGARLLVLLVAGGAVLHSQSPRQESDNLQLVLDWHRDVMTAGKLDMAPHYMGDAYVEHDPNIGGGRKEFVEYYAKNPPRVVPASLKPQVQFAKGDYVVLMWDVPDKDAKTGTPYTYTFYDVQRVENGTITEHWNSRSKSASGAAPEVEAKRGTYPAAPVGIQLTGVYDTSSIRYTPEEERNIRVVTTFFLEVRESRHYERAYELMHRDGYVQHNPAFPSTGESVIAFYQSRNLPPLNPILEQFGPPAPPLDLLLAKNDIVLLMFDAQVPDPQDRSKMYTQRRFEVLRVDNGKIREHWDAGDRKNPNGSPLMVWCVRAGRTDCPKP